VNGAVLVTGGSRGIGRAIVRALCASGRKVAFTYRDGEEAARSWSPSWTGWPAPGATTFAIARAPARSYRRWRPRWGPSTGLVNNAAIRRDALLGRDSRRRLGRRSSMRIWRRIRCCRAVLPGMIARRVGSIVNISSLTAMRGVAGQTSYGAAKAGLIGMTKSLAREVGRRNIRVNAVVPGLVMTEMIADTPAEKLASLRATEALPSGTLPEDVASLVVLLVSDAGRAITGQAILVDAGSTA
jgi:3-oxoacyl-[acyl-carrier protein] reductase